jgi:hypothetical protein
MARVSCKTSQMRLKAERIIPDLNLKRHTDVLGHDGGRSLCTDTGRNLLQVSRPFYQIH